MTMSNTPTNTRVVFFQVNDNLTKVKRIVETAHAHFEKKEPFLIVVEDETSLKFVDDLLWKYPPEGFLPHVATDESSSELIVITKTKKNLNGAKRAFNLCPTSLLLETPLKMIYEFEDLTAPIKKNLSSGRFDVYKGAGFLIEAR